ncbi:UDP-glucose 4-epimerase [Orenia metallireducens]|uniref:UDP-glucose 4-epimerase n=1 Tax=Orenia metallireducens TaxID=1413210 RepID=A0A1C0A612_9FIRM|nr:UDP-glucose 4-epimerase [Orenia metallireducens]
METYLVTGGAGFIGSHIVDKLIAKGKQVIIIDNLSTGKKENINQEAIFYELDIRDNLSELFNQHKIDYIIHHAAQIDIQYSLREPDFDSDVNITGSVNLFNHAVKAGVKKVIYASSAAVYGQPEYLAIDEKHPVNPISYYGISKHTPEHYLKVFKELYNLDYIVLRYANAYGVRQDPKGEGGVISIFVDKFLNNERPIIFGNGEQTRDFVYVDDIAWANLLAVEKGSGEIINISCNVQTSVNELVEIMKETIGSSLEAEYQDARAGDIKDSYLDNTKAKEILGWEAKYDLKRGLKETFEYYR